MEPHAFVAYPKGHAVQTACVKCGRPRENAIHVEPVRQPGETQYPPLSAVRRGARF
jgi:hypothetical protein